MDPETDDTTEMDENINESSQEDEATEQGDDAQDQGSETTGNDEAGSEFQSNSELYAELKRTRDALKKANKDAEAKRRRAKQAEKELERSQMSQEESEAALRLENEEKLGRIPVLETELEQTREQNEVSQQLVSDTLATVMAVLPMDEAMRSLVTRLPPNEAVAWLTEQSENIMNRYAQQQAPNITGGNSGQDTTDVVEDAREKRKQRVAKRHYSLSSRQLE